MAQYPVPQFIEEESKIVFFLTFRQFFLLVAAGAISFLLFITLPLPLFVVGAIATVTLCVVIAFVKVNGMPVLKVAFHYLGFVTQSKNYIWKKKGWSENESPSIPELSTGKLDEVKKRIETKR